jgi:hypothetical protein
MNMQVCLVDVDVDDPESIIVVLSLLWWHLEQSLAWILWVRMSLVFVLILSFVLGFDPN